jgi:hypothetical protein
MHPYFVPTIAADHRARLAAEAAPSVHDAERAGLGWRQWLRTSRQRAEAGPSPSHAQPAAAAPPRLAPVLVMAPPFPPGAHGPGGSAEPPPFDLAS